MILKRADIADPMPPEEAVAVGSLGGELIVKGLLLSERLQMAIDETLSGPGRCAEILARCVLADDRKPLFTAQQWEAFGARHYDEALELFAVAHRLSGLGEQKN